MPDPVAPQAPVAPPDPVPAPQGPPSTPSAPAAPAPPSIPAGHRLVSDDDYSAAQQAREYVQALDNKQNVLIGEDGKYGNAEDLREFVATIKQMRELGLSPQDITDALGQAVPQQTEPQYLTREDLNSELEKHGQQMNQQWQQREELNIETTKVRAALNKALGREVSDDAFNNGFKPGLVASLNRLAGEKAATPEQIDQAVGDYLKLINLQAFQQQAAAAQAGASPPATTGGGAPGAPPAQPASRRDRIRQNIERFKQRAAAGAT